MILGTFLMVTEEALLVLSPELSHLWVHLCRRLRRRRGGAA